MSGFLQNSAVAAGSSGQGRGYNLLRSLRLRASASAYLSRTPATSSGQTTWTLSRWGKICNISTGVCLLSVGTDGNNYTRLDIDTNGKLNLNIIAGGISQAQLISTQVFRDPSAWGNIVVVYDVTQATASNRIQFWYNGNRITAFDTANYPALNVNWSTINTNNLHRIGSFYANVFSPSYFDDLQTETIMVSGQALTPSSFGEFDSITGVWKPKRYAGTYGTNGFYLNFEDNSAATAAAIGKDSSGNGNNWTPNNISLTAGVTYDSMTDVPTLTSATAANYAVLNPIVASAFIGGATINNGNLRVIGLNGVSNTFARSTMAISGKMYAEFSFDVVSSAASIGVAPFNDTAANGGLYVQNTNICYRSGGNKRVLGTETAYGASWVANDIIGVAVDTAANTVEFFKNGVSQGVITSSTFFAQGACAFAIATDDAGSPIGNANFGQRPFSYTPPTGFVALNTFNLPDSTIKAGNAAMSIALDTGANIKATTEALFSGSQFFEWIKDRANANNHQLLNSVRGLSAVVQSNTQAAETTYVVPSGNSVGYAWKAGSSSSSNTSGTITSTVSVNQNAGCSIINFNGNGVLGATVGHGLGVAPGFGIFKNLNDVVDWQVYHAALGGNACLFLNTNGPSSTAAGWWNNTSASSSVITLGNSGYVNASGKSILAILWAEIPGYSKFGTYIGNGSLDGPMVYTGMRGRWLLIKAISSVSGGNWVLIDTAKSTFNVCANWLFPDLTAGEQTYANVCDINSNGFKLRSVWDTINSSGATYSYAMFAENPFKNSLAR